MKRLPLVLAALGLASILVACSGRPATQGYNTFDPTLIWETGAYR